jgi:hypothetical protein
MSIGFGVPFPVTRQRLYLRPVRSRLDDRLALVVVAILVITLVVGIIQVLVHALA